MTRDRLFPTTTSPCLTRNGADSHRFCAPKARASNHAFCRLRPNDIPYDIGDKLLAKRKRKKPSRDDNGFSRSFAPMKERCHTHTVDNRFCGAFKLAGDAGEPQSCLAGATLG